MEEVVVTQECVHVLEGVGGRMLEPIWERGGDETIIAQGTVVQCIVERSPIRHTGEESAGTNGA